MQHPYRVILSPAESPFVLAPCRWAAHGPLNFHVPPPPFAGEILASKRASGITYKKKAKQPTEHGGGKWRIFNIEVSPEKDPGKDHYALSQPLLEAIASSLDCPVKCLTNAAFSVVRKSFDARKDTDGPKFVYIVDLHLEKMDILSSELRSKISRFQNKPGKLEFLTVDESPDDPPALVKGDVTPNISLTSKARVIAHSSSSVTIVGSGPAGLFAALVLAESGVKVTLVERGQPVESRGRDIGGLMVRRVLQPDSNFCFGEGGAGTWSDGKLTTRTGRNSTIVQKVFSTLVKFGAPPCILIDGKPHIGTDNLVHILQKFRLYLQSLGVKIMFGTKMVEFLIIGNRMFGVQVDSASGFDRKIIMSDAVVLAVGHSARDVYRKLLEHNVLLTPKDFAVGLRVEHPQTLIDKIQYSKWAAEVQRGNGKIPVADYKFATAPKSAAGGKYGCYSFCMCPGGQIVPTTTDPVELCINGMSFSKRSSKWANAAIVVTVSSLDIKPFMAEHGPLAGMAFQRWLEQAAARMGGGHMVAPVQTVPDFLDNRVSGSTLPSSSYRLGVKEAPLHKLFPEYMTDILKTALVNFEGQMPGFIDQSALFHAVETRTSSPLRVERDEQTLECISMHGLYPIGEGSGYAGGIVSAAVDGMRTGYVLAQQLGLPVQSI